MTKWLCPDSHREHRPDRDHDIQRGEHHECNSYADGDGDHHHRSAHADRDSNAARPRALPIRPRR